MSFSNASHDSISVQEASRKRTFDHVEDSVHAPNQTPRAHIKRARVAPPQPQIWTYAQPQNLINHSTGVTPSYQNTQHFALGMYAGSRGSLVQGLYPRSVENAVCFPHQTRMAYINSTQIAPRRAQNVFHTQPQRLVYHNTGMTTSTQDFAPGMSVGSRREVVQSSYQTINYQTRARDEEFEAFKLKLALELLMSPTSTTPVLMNGSQCSPSTSYPSLPSSRDPSPTVPFRHVASYPHDRPSNPAIERRNPMPRSYGHEVLYGSLESQMISPTLMNAHQSILTTSQPLIPASLAPSQTEPPETTVFSSHRTFGPVIERDYSMPLLYENLPTAVPYRLA
ncbi:uncharacterized protein MELLADRAFT_60033 [Melampsora larici-populina 98AG31]|uniref:Uncharacterized protein n=1 Tax=Melampsora larici-populina (strain 98AG31 / pathotype 3-4-7) TaxID=747676 RepID=F4R9Q9_MELLP|nr:uncharacterized protein MELLADRAFT_60033 [Melampsora larici-populina 98AG31]EGG11022.1 hypothetical protein MELLADRAFT_60033 [Melampsora larici-populina 98AG31]